MLHENSPKIDEGDKFNDWQRAVEDVEEQIKAINVAKYDEIIEMKNKCQNIDKEKSVTLNLYKEL